MKYYAYSTVLRRLDGVSSTTSSSLGYAPAANEDEARGIAVRMANVQKPSFDIVQVSVIELKGLVPEAKPEEDTEHD